MDILSALSNTPINQVIAKYEGQTQYGTLKTDVAEVVKAFLSEFQSKLKNVDETTLQAKLESSENAMNIVANQTLLKVQKAVGLRN